MYDVRIDEGIAQGIYTTAENAAEYNENLEMIRRADIASSDNFLCVPINALCYLETLLYNHIKICSYVSACGHVGMRYSGFK